MCVWKTVSRIQGDLQVEEIVSAETSVRAVLYVSVKSSVKGCYMFYREHCQGGVLVTIRDVCFVFCLVLFSVSACHYCL